jgi:hypothetical protein
MHAAHLAPQIAGKRKIDLKHVRHDQGIIYFPGKPEKEISFDEIR